MEWVGELVDRCEIQETAVCVWRCCCRMEGVAHGAPPRFRAVGTVNAISPFMAELWAFEGLRYGPTINTLHSNLCQKKMKKKEKKKKRGAREERRRRSIGKEQKSKTQNNNRQNKQKKRKKTKKRQDQWRWSKKISVASWEYRLEVIQACLCSNSFFIAVSVSFE